MARLISICGIDGSGKSTQVHQLARYLTSLGFLVAQTKVNFRSWSVILGLGKRIGPEFADFLSVVTAAERESVIACDVVCHADTVVKQLLSDHDIIIWDRGPLCYAANAEAHGAKAPWLWALYRSLPVPNLSVLLDLPGEVSAARIASRKEKIPLPDESAEFLSAVRREYLRLENIYPNVRRIDANRPIDVVANSIIAEVIPLLPLMGSSNSHFGDDSLE